MMNLIVTNKFIGSLFQSYSKSIIETGKFEGLESSFKSLIDSNQTTLISKYWIHQIIACQKCNLGSGFNLIEPNGKMDKDYKPCFLQLSQGNSVCLPSGVLDFSSKAKDISYFSHFLSWACHDMMRIKLNKQHCLTHTFDEISKQNVFNICILP